MKANVRATLALAALAALTPAENGDGASREQKKQDALRAIDARKDELIAMSDRIWAFAETALREKRSAALLAGYAEQHGFRVERGVAAMPTAFVASFGSGKPVIGVLGEFDALPGLSQKATATREALEPGAPGHGCGHNLFGAASLGAALAIKEAIAAGTLKGTIRFYGTPAEEAIGGKIYMARDGLFDDLDVCLAWHPSDKTQADTNSSQAIIDFIVEFHGRTAHAAGDPWNGRSAVDALELCTHGTNLMREHIKPTSRVHYTIVDGGHVPNVVPAYAKLWCWVRDWKRSEADHLLARVKKIAEGAAIMAEVESKVTVQSGDWEMLVNRTGAKLLHANLEWLGPIAFTPEEQEFARAIQRACGVEEKGLDGKPRSLEGQEQEGGSSDVGDVSWVVPTLHVSVTAAPEGAPWHAWPVVACSGMSIGHRGLAHAAKVLAATMIDLFEDAETRAAIRAEFEKSRAGETYVPYIPPGPPPVPKD